MNLGKTFGRGCFLIAAAALLSSGLFAQQSPTKDPDVHALAQRVDQHYNKLRSLKAAFTESYVGLGMRGERRRSGFQPFTPRKSQRPSMAVA